MILRKKQIAALKFDGLSITDYTAGLNESSSFAVIEVPGNIRHKLSWSKRSDKYYYVVKGEIEFTIDSETNVLKEGDFCIVRKGSKFYYYNATKKAATLILVHTPNFNLDEEVFE
jgi:mannose-6-phosphate isomerase-like protein (cupin superfamily)